MKKCTFCGILVTRKINPRSKKIYCGRECYWESLKMVIGESHPLFLGKKRHQVGYVLVYSPEHPRAQRDGYVFEHLLVVEKIIGRFITKKEEVHHINKIKNDNRPENLKLCKDRKEHARYEVGWYKKNSEWYKICKGCNIEKQVSEENFYKRNTGAAEFVSDCKECQKKTSRKRTAKMRSN